MSNALGARKVRATTRRTLLLLAAALALALGASALVVAVLLRDDGESGIPVLAYHGVTTDPTVVHGAADPRFFDVRLPAFREQMTYLDDAGFQTITPTQYRQWLSGETATLPPKPILITFDDGQTSAQLATPVLNQHGFVSVMYVVSGFADGDFGGPQGEQGWYLTWYQLKAMKANGTWIMQFHAGPRGHAYIRNAADPNCHYFYPCRFGEDDATYEARVKSDVAQGLGALRSVFELPAGWRGPTYAVPWDEPGQPSATAEPWLSAYFASQFPVVFVQESYHGDVSNQRYRFEIHNPDDLEAFKSGLSSSRFAR